jgi:hypothetical protein
MQGEKVFSELGLKTYVRRYDDETVVAVSDLDDSNKSFYVSTFPEGVSEGIVSRSTSARPSSVSRWACPRSRTSASG